MTDQQPKKHTKDQYDRVMELADQIFGSGKHHYISGFLNSNDSDTETVRTLHDATYQECQDLIKALMLRYRHDKGESK